MAFANYSSQRPFETTHAFIANYFLILWYCVQSAQCASAQTRFFRPNTKIARMAWTPAFSRSANPPRTPRTTPALPRPHCPQHAGKKWENMGFNIIYSEIENQTKVDS